MSKRMLLVTVGPALVAAYALLTIGGGHATGHQVTPVGTTATQIG